MFLLPARHAASGFSQLILQACWLCTGDFPYSCDIYFYVVDFGVYWFGCFLQTAMYTERSYSGLSEILAHRRTLGLFAAAHLASVGSD